MWLRWSFWTIKLVRRLEPGSDKKRAQPLLYEVETPLFDQAWMAGNPAPEAGCGNSRMFSLVVRKLVEAIVEMRKFTRSEGCKSENMKSKLLSLLKDDQSHSLVVCNNPCLSSKLWTSKCLFPLHLFFWIQTKKIPTDAKRRKCVKIYKKHWRTLVDFTLDSFINLSVIPSHWLHLNKSIHLSLRVSPGQFHIKANKISCCQYCNLVFIRWSKCRTTRNSTVAISSQS